MSRASLASNAVFCAVDCGETALWHYGVVTTPVSPEPRDRCLSSHHDTLMRVGSRTLLPSTTRSPGLRLVTSWLRTGPLGSSLNPALRLLGGMSASLLSGFKCHRSAALSRRQRPWRPPSNVKHADQDLVRGFPFSESAWGHFPATTRLGGLGTRRRACARLLPD